MEMNRKNTKSTKENDSNQSDKWNPSKSLGNSDQLHSDDNVSVGQPVSDLLANTTSNSANSSHHHSRSSSFPYQPKTLIDDRLEQIRLQYEIKQDFIERLRKLESYKIILLCDDSGSMNTPVDKTERTRWDELYDFVQMILEIGIIFDPTGVDIYFLHRKPLLNVIDRQTIKEIFSQSPSGGCTPLVSVLRHLFQLPSTRRGNDRKALVFIATDGAPTDEKGNDNLDELKHLMNYERQVQTTHVMFLICTDDPDCIEYLNDWDKTMKNVDVTDNFKSEREKVRKYRGSKYPFSKGDYIVKALLGAIDSYIDGINEPSPEIHFN